MEEGQQYSCVFVDVANRYALR